MIRLFDTFTNYLCFRFFSSSQHRSKIFPSKVTVNDNQQKSVKKGKLLGHSVQTNLRYYTFAKSDEYLDELRNVLDGVAKDTDKTVERTDSTGSNEGSTSQYLIKMWP